MGRRQRTLFVVLIALVMAAALFSAFSLSLFHKTPAVVMPSLSPLTDAPPSASPQGDYAPLEVRTDTVQQVIATLDRPESYARTVTVETQSEGDAFGVLTAKVTVDGGWTQVDAALPDGRVAHSIVGDGSRYVWYGDETAYRQYAADDHSADLSQRLPTYEDVLAADPAHIAAAGYQSVEGLPCIYVAVREPELGYVESYWVSVDTGLLVYAISEENGNLFYRMSSYTVETPVSPGTTFTLPDGAVVHTTALPD